MKYWRGYITAALVALLTWALITFCQSHSVLVDMIYPYFSRLVQTFLAEWSSGVDFCLWQILVTFAAVIAIATVVLMIIFRWNFFQWLGWVLACVSVVLLLHTGLFGLNYYAGPLADDIRLTVSDEEYTVTERMEATLYFRDKANELAASLPRNEAGDLDFPTFEEMAQAAGRGFEILTYDYSYPVFAGSTVAVKKLGWSEMYTSMGITGVTMGITGEAAVNPEIPPVSLPFTMCHEMAHRMCIAQERDANLAAYLACIAHDDPVFQYSGYFMAFRYSYNALLSVGTTAAKNACDQIMAGVNTQLSTDLTRYKAFFAARQDAAASAFASSVNDTYIKVSGDSSGTGSYSEVADLLVAWHIQEIYLPAHKDEVQQFDPLDKNQVDLGEGYE